MVLFFIVSIVSRVYRCYWLLDIVNVDTLRLAESGVRFVSKISIDSVT